MSNELAEKQDDKTTIKARLQGPEFQQQLAMVLDGAMTPERMVRVALTAMLRTPNLAKCDQASFFKCILQLAELGLEPNDRDAYLIPFENRKKGTTECQLIVGYKGYATLLMRSGLVSSIHADLVCKLDEWEYNKGEIITHRPDFQNRGPAFACYALARLTSGGEKAEVLTMDEIIAIRDESQGWKAFKNGYTKTTPWESNFHEMCKKTAFRRLTKWMSLTPQLVRANEIDDQIIDGEVVQSRRLSARRPIKSLATRSVDAPQVVDAPQDTETPEQAFRRCLAEIGPMDYAAAKALIDNTNTTGWKDEWSYEIDAALEAKASK